MAVSIQPGEESRRGRPRVDRNRRSLRCSALIGPTADRPTWRTRQMRIRWRGLELPSRVVCAREKLSDIYGEFHVEPFERGFGHTVGNSLRRILLSSLEGSAVTTIKIQGVQHEFSSIPGMVEDITDLVLNLKLLVVKNHSEHTRTIRIE